MSALFPKTTIRDRIRFAWHDALSWLARRLPETEEQGWIRAGRDFFEEEATRLLGENRALREQLSSEGAAAELVRFREASYAKVDTGNIIGPNSSPHFVKVATSRVEIHVFGDSEDDAAARAIANIKTIGLWPKPAAVEGASDA